MLEVKLPGIDGFQVLKAVRFNPKLRALPSLMLTSSSDEAQIRRACELGENSCLQKPADDFVDLIGDIDRFWLRRARLPVIIPG